MKEGNIKYVPLSHQLMAPSEATPYLTKDFDKLQDLRDVNRGGSLAEYLFLPKRLNHIGQFMLMILFSPYYQSCKLSTVRIGYGNERVSQKIQSVKKFSLELRNFSFFKQGDKIIYKGKYFKDTQAIKPNR